MWHLLADTVYNVILLNTDIMCGRRQACHSFLADDFDSNFLTSVIHKRQSHLTKRSSDRYTLILT